MLTIKSGDLLSLKVKGQLYTYRYVGITKKLLHLLPAYETVPVAIKIADVEEVRVGDKTVVALFDAYARLPRQSKQPVIVREKGFRPEFKTNRKPYLPFGRFDTKWLKVRQTVLKRDGYKCKHCGATSDCKQLHVDHIKPKSKYPELGYDEENLQTLCFDCNIGKGTSE